MHARLRHCSALVVALAVAAACGDDDGTTAPPALDASGDASTSLDTGAMTDLGPRDAARDTASAADLGTVDGGPDDAGPGAVLPARFRVEGSALGASDDDRVTAECTFYGDIDMIEATEDGFTGFIAGEVFRYVTVDGMRYELQALIGGPITITEVQPGTIAARLVGDQSAPEVKPFWRELEEITAEEGEPDHYAGAWQCAQLDIDMPPGFVDTFLVVPGEWRLFPAVSP